VGAVNRAISNPELGKRMVMEVLLVRPVLGGDGADPWWRAADL